MIYIPQGKLALTPAEQRQQIREALLRGQTIPGGGATLLVFLALLVRQMMRLIIPL